MDLIADAINADTRAYARRWRYYQGSQPRRWVTAKMVHIFGALSDAMAENYCALAVNSRVSRLEITGWDGADGGLVTSMWTRGRWPVRQADLIRWGLVYGSAYVICDQGPQGPAMALNRPTLIHAVPFDDDPYRIDTAVKVWYGRGLWRATVWDAQDITRLVFPGHTDPTNRPTNAKDAVIDPDDPGGRHGFDTCPVIPVLPYGLDAPVLLDILAPVQDRINKISANKFVAAEFGAFRQRVFFMTQDVEDDTLVNAPDHAIILDPGERDAPARVQELAATDLANYDRSLDREVQALFTLATLPRHLLVNPGVAPSGEAIRADEGPLVQTIRDHQREFGDGLRRAMALFGYDDADPVWRDPEVTDDTVTAATVRQFTDAGLPWQAIVTRYAGWDADDVAAAEELVAAAPTGPGVGPVTVGGTLRGGLPWDEEQATG